MEKSGAGIDFELKLLVAVSPNPGFLVQSSWNDQAIGLTSSRIDQKYDLIAPDYGP